MSSTDGLLCTDPVRLIERASGFDLSPMQRALVAIGTGSKLADLTGDVRGCAEHALGYDAGPQRPLRVLFFNKGARGGGTMLASYLAALRALTCDLSGLAPGESARVAHLSGSMRQARHGLRYALGFIKSLGLEKLIKSERRDSFTLARDGHEVEFLVLRSNTSGDDIAGHWYAAVVIHEASIAADPSSGGVAVDLDAIERAARPRLLPPRGKRPGGLVMYETTSRDAAGPAFEKFTENHGRRASRVVAFRATTLELRPDDEALSEHIDAEREADSVNAEREFDCVWTSHGDNGAVFGDDLLELCLTDCPVNLPPDPSLQSWAGIDLAFSSDGSALAIVRKRSDGQFELCALKRWRPKRKQPLRPTEVINEIFDVMEAHGSRVIWADIHHLAQLQEIASSHRRGIHIKRAPAGSGGKYSTHQSAKTMMASGMLFVGDDRLLVKSLRSIRAHREASGIIKIHTPRSRKAGHGDDASALVLALHAAQKVIGRGVDPPPRIGKPTMAAQLLGIVSADGTPRDNAGLRINDFHTGVSFAFRGPRNQFSDRSTFRNGGF